MAKPERMSAEEVDQLLLTADLMERVGVCRFSEEGEGVEFPAEPAPSAGTERLLADVQATAPEAEDVRPSRRQAA